MKIYIPTIGNREQKTVGTLPINWLDDTIVVAPLKECDTLRKSLPDLVTVVPQPSNIKGIAAVRQWIIDREDGKILMLDDDLKFAARGEGGKLHPASGKEIESGLVFLRMMLDEHAHGSISTREGNNRVIEDLTYCGRPLRALAYDCKMVKKVGARFDRIPLMEDFDMTLQLMRAGFENFTIWDLCHDQGSSNAPGGCSTYRTPELQDKAAKELARLHPEFVKVVYKESKTSWGNGFDHKRTDVRISWKKAYESSR